MGLVFLPTRMLFFLGADDDLKIYQSNGNSVVKSQTGVLYLLSNSHIDLRTSGGGSEKQAIFCNIHGAVELYYDNSKKFETVSGGINVVGTVTDDGANHDGDVNFYGVSSYNAQWDKSDASLKFLDNAQIKLGSGNDLQIYHDGTHSHLVNSTGNLRILADGAGDLVLTSKAGEEAIKCVQDGNVQLMYDNVKS